MNATIKQRFKVVPFTNARTGSISWRVTGRKRDGTRIRENFKDEHSAKCRQVELEAEYLKRETETTIRSTKLTDVQLHLAELAFARLDDDADLPRAVDYWLQHGRQNAIAGESPRIDDAVKQFAAWLDDEPTANGNGRCTLREHSRKGLKVRVGIFANSIGNSRVNQITPDTVEKLPEQAARRFPGHPGQLPPRNQPILLLVHPEAATVDDAEPMQGDSH